VEFQNVMFQNTSNFEKEILKPRSEADNIVSDLNGGYSGSRMKYDYLVIYEL